jgi:pimeloyl-ACP methyl ester carboxylesterase
MASGTSRRRRLVTRPALVAAAAGAGSALGMASATVATSAYIARRVLTPDELQPDDVAVTAHDGDSVTFGATVDTTAPGRYGVWLDGGRGHLRVGEVLSRDAMSVRRALVSVDRGEVSVGPARWNQYYYWDRPSVSLGLPDEDVEVRSDVGAMPAWLVRPPSPSGDGGDWAVLVHGRGARKEETLRAVPVLQDAGWSALVVAYRNDRDAPRGPDGRYNLGLSEWRDVEAAVRYAVEHGARRVVLFGWSMGGAIALQLLAQSPLAHHVVAVVLDSPVVDWGSVIAHHARTNRFPSPLVSLTTGLMASSHARRLVGVIEPVDVALTDWVTRADELTRPMLVIASAGDAFVPDTAALALAERRPDLVRLERWEVARHCREWNTDPVRWERAVRDFLVDLGRPRST